MFAHKEVLGKDAPCPSCGRDGNYHITKVDGPAIGRECQCGYTWEIDAVKPDLHDICRRCVIAWGLEFQLDQTIEELAELIKAINHWKRNKGVDPALRVIEEVGDVELMLEQVKVIVDRFHKLSGGDADASVWRAVEAWKRLKLEELERKLKEAGY